MKSPTPSARAMLAQQREALRDDEAAIQRRKALLRTPKIREGFALLAKVARRAATAHCSTAVDVSVHSFADTYTNQVNATVYLTVAGLKGNHKLNNFLSWMLDHFEPRPSADWVTEYTTSRTFTFRNDSVVVELVCRVPDDSPTCRKVKTGTKLVEQDTYAIECV